MRYYVTLDRAADAEPATVDLVERPDGALEARIDGHAVEIDVVAIGGQLSVRVDGHVFDLTTDGSGPDLGVTTRGHRWDTRVETERMRSFLPEKKPTTLHFQKAILSPMPGRVVTVLVVEGSLVERGQPLVVIEAMKMENEVRAPASGTIAAVHVSAGMAIDGGALLVTLA